MDTKLYVVTHKTVSAIPPQRTLIGVGNGEIEHVSLRDSSGENISEKNPNYCELTALYWIWKNDRSELVGLEHYRRFFCDLLTLKPLSLAAIEEKLEKADVLLPTKMTFPYSIYEQYKICHIVSDLDCCREIIGEKSPEYLPSFDEVMNRKYGYMFNMFVMQGGGMRFYSEWLFPILFEAEERIDLTGRDRYQQRVFGFLAERLFQVWILHHHLRIKCAPVCGMDEKKKAGER